MQLIDRALIEKYLNDQCSPEEEEIIHLWIDNNDADNYPSVLSEAKYLNKEKKTWKRLSAELEGLQLQHSNHKHLSFNFLLRCAAVFFLLLTSIWALNSFTNGMFWWKGDQYTTGYGETRQINLQDGSVVMLNAMSELKVSRDYGKNKRELYLKGEGYFKVQKDKHRPFIVYTKDIASRALGTQFNVSAYPEDKQVIVSLQEGKLEVKRLRSESVSQEAVFLGQGQEVSYASHQLLKKTFKDKERLSWKEHILYFKDNNMENVLGRLSRFYGVSFDYSALKDNHWKLNGEYKNQSLNDVLESLSFNYSFRYQIIGDKVILSQ